MTVYPSYPRGDGNEQPARLSGMNQIIPETKTLGAVLPARLRPASIAAAIAAAATIFTWFGFIDLQGATTDFLAIKLLDRRSRF